MKSIKFIPNAPKLLWSVQNGNSLVRLYSDGTKIRETIDPKWDVFVPEFPENVDLKLTDKCSQGCAFCYEGSSPSGTHADWKKFEFLRHLPPMEMAINGNDLDVPDLNEFLELMKSQKVIVNMTVNQNQFMKSYELIKKLIFGDLIHGIGISLKDPTDEFISKAKEFKNAVIHVINGIVTVDQLKKLKGMKILILGYKYTGRGIKNYDDHTSAISRNKTELNDYIPEAFKLRESTWVFDNLAIEQLPNVRKSISDGEWKLKYMGDEGSHTFYIDLVKGQYGQNSINPTRYEIGDKSIYDMFKDIRTKSGFSNFNWFWKFKVWFYIHILRHFMKPASHNVRVRRKVLETNSSSEHAFVLESEDYLDTHFGYTDMYQEPDTCSGSNYLWSMITQKLSYDDNHEGWGVDEWVVSRLNEVAINISIALNRDDLSFDLFEMDDTPCLDHSGEHWWILGSIFDDNWNVKDTELLIKMMRTTVYYGSDNDECSYLSNTYPGLKDRDIWEDYHYW